MNYRCFNRNLLAFATLLSLALGVMMLGGCGASRQSSLWKDSSYKAAPAKKILVIAMRNDPLRRRMWEDAVVSAMSDEKRGTTAIASYQLFPEQVPDTLAIALKSKEDGFDGVLLIAAAHLDTFTTMVAGYTTNEQVTRFSQRWNAYITNYENFYHPGYPESETVVSVRTDLLIPQQDGKLVFSVTSRSVDPSSIEEFRNSVADRVVDQLRKERLIK